MEDSEARARVRLIHPTYHNDLPTMLNIIHDPIEALEEFIKLSSALSQEQNVNCLLKKIVNTACQLTGAEMGCLYRLDQTKSYLYLDVLQNTAIAESSVQDLPRVSLQQQNSAPHLCAYVASSGKSVNLPDAYHYSGFDCQDLYRYDAWKKYHCKSLLAVPMRGHAGFTIGILQLINHYSVETENIESFSEKLVELTEAFASQAAIVIDNARLIEENKGLIRDLKQNNQSLQAENTQLKNTIAARRWFNDSIIGEGPAMQRIFDLMGKVAESNISVFLRGETGTGKELIANAIHQQSARSNKRFVAQNCAALPENLLESELFGYKSGAFSGATKDKKGLIEIADGGTLFLDEIGDMPMGLQVKLLRVLEEYTIRPLGTDQEKKVDFRVISATHHNPEELIKEGRLREDLYFRLHKFPINIPPLRQRKDDLPQLLQHFLQHFAEAHGKHIHGFSAQALFLLKEHDYPGNIRELKGLVEYAVVLCDEQQILPEHLDRRLFGLEANGSAIDIAAIPKGSLKHIMQHYEARVLQQHLDLHNGNQTKTAEALEISRRSLVSKISLHNLKNNN